MKTNILLFLMISTLSYSQIWINDVNDAKKMAKATGKLIILDFNASWCKHCKRMESEFWNNTKYKETSDKFIVVPVDVDYNKQIADSYSVKSIPNIKVIDVNGEVLHGFLGYYDAKSYNEELKGFPRTTADLYNNLKFQNEKKPTDEELLFLASSYQALIQTSTTPLAKNIFSNLSNTYFNTCSKISKNEDYIEKADLSKSFNYVLTDNAKKAIKMIDISKVSEENKAYAFYILANAHYIEKNNLEAEKDLENLQKTNSQEWITYGNALRSKYGQ